MDSLLRAEQLYSCSEAGVHILHDTVIKLDVERIMGCGMMRQADSLSSLLLGDDSNADFQEYQSQDSLQVMSIKLCSCLLHACAGDAFVTKWFVFFPFRYLAVL